MIKKLFLALLLNIILAQNSSAIETVQIELIIKNHRFIPELLKLPAGKRIRLTIHNQDSTIEEFESRDLKREKIIMPKAKTSIILAPLLPGEYEFFGEFHEETAKGKIIVEIAAEELKVKIDNDQQNTGKS